MKRSRHLFLWVLIAWCAGLVGAAGCRSTSNPTGVAGSYLHALQSGDLERAYGLLSDEQRARVTFEQFKARHATADDVQTRAQRLNASTAAWSTEDGLLQLRFEGGKWLFEDTSLEADPREAVRSFVGAVEAGDFAWAHRLLSKEWRAQYTLARFKEDFEREPLANKRVARLRAAVSQKVRYTATGAELPLPGYEGAARLVLEEDGYHLAALE